MQNCPLSCLKEILTCLILDRVKSTFRFVRFTTYITRLYIKHTPGIMYSPLCHHWTWSHALWDISRSPKDIRYKDIIIKSFHLLSCDVGSPCIPQILRFRNLRALVTPWVICHRYQTLHPHNIKETATSVVQFTSVVALLQILWPSHQSITIWPFARVAEAFLYISLHSIAHSWPYIKDICI